MRYFILPLLLLAACGGGTISPSPPVTIPDPTVYLAMSRCADGQPAVVETGCQAALQRASDAMDVRHGDWSGHADGQIEDDWGSDDGSYFVTSFSYPPNLAFVSAHGDGGDVLVYDGTSVRVNFTQNGVPGGGTASGYWVGAGCGGTGWKLFDRYAPTGGWASIVAELAASSDDPSACPDLGTAYTQWRAEQAIVPFVVSGVQQGIVLPVIVSEHYSGATITSSSEMERYVLASGFGRVAWEAWSTAPSTSAFQCAGVSPWNQPPAPGWYLQDRRCLTAVVGDSRQFTGDAYGWPPLPQ